MAQVSYGTITITDTNDIERIYMVYAGSSSDTVAPDKTNYNLWKTDITLVSGDYIWQRAVVKKSGIDITGSNFQEYYGDPVCVTGPEGDQGKGVKSLVTQYYLSTSSSSATGGSWSATPQSYPTTGTKYYWTKTITTYTDNSTYESTPVYNVALTNSVKNARDANTIANEAKELSEQTHVDVVNLQTRTKYFWTNLVAHTNGASGWTKPDYPVGTFAASGISGTTFDEEDSSTYGYNTSYSNGIKLRYNAINLGELTGTALTFFHPSQSSQGAKAMELSGSALKFYDATGTTAQAEFGGTQARVSGTINAYDGQIGNSNTNYWYIGNYTDYNQNQSAAMRSYGSAFIQLGDSNTWRLATNRFHSAWNDDSSGTSGQLHYPTYDSKYWDSGLHLPTSLTDKFLYIRNAPNTQTLENLQNDLEDSGYDYWTYRFYISADGSLYARNIYVLDDNGNTTQIGGTDGVYLLKSGGTITGNLEVNGTLTKGSKNVAYFTTAPTTGQIVVTDGTTGGVKTTGYTIAKSVPSNALFTDANVAQTATTTNSTYELLFSGTADNTTRTEGARKTSTLTYNPSTKALVTGGTVNGYTLAAASAKGVDTSMTASSTSTNLPTTKAVVDLIKTYLPLSGGTVSGETIFNDAVSVNDEFDADSITAGNLIVNGVGRFTNGIYGDLTGNVTGNVTGSLTGNATTATTATTATKVGNNLIIKLNSGTTEGTNMFTFNGSAAKTVDVTKSAIGLGNVENKSSATIRGELTSANVTTALGFTPYDSTNPNGYTTNTGTVTSVRIQATSPVVSSVSTASSTTLNTTISLADGYGDTKNPYGSKTARYVLAAPANAAGAPTFRALTNADVGLSNVTNNKQVKGLSSGTTSGHLVTWGSDGYTVADSGVALAPNGNTRGIVSGLASDNNGKIVLTYADGTTSNPIEVKIIGQEGSSVSYADKLNVNGAAVGSATVPVYFNANGEVQTANTYAGGTAVTLNGSSKASSTASFYAPTGAGTSGQVLTSSGGTPGWTNQSSLSVGSATTATKFSSNRTVALTGDVTGSVSGDGSSGWSVATTVQDNSHNHTLATILPLKSKTFTDVIGTANNWANATFFFGSIKPDTWNEYWRIKYKIRVYVPGQPNYNQIADVMISGRAGDFKAYYSLNTIGAYYVCYYHELYRLKEAGFNAGYGHSIGVRFYSAYNPIDANYKRTIEVEILETENCSFDFYNSCLKYAEIPGTGTTNYNTYTEMDFVTNGLQETGDANDVNYYNRSYHGSRTTKNALYRYQFCVTDSTGQVIPINSVNNSVATNKTLMTDSFDPFGEIFQWASTSTYAAGANVGNGYWYRQYLADLRYSFNCGGYDVDSTLIARLPLYLVVVPQGDGTVKLHSEPLSQTLPTSDDGLLYIYLGRVYEDTKPYRVVLTFNHPVYWYKDGAVRQYTQYAADAATVNGHTIGANVPSNAVFTDTWKALSISQAGYVSQAPNDASKFLRGDATWAAVTKANVGLGNVENTALSTWAGSTNITTLGTISTGTWSGSTIAVNKGGTGATTFTSGAALIGNGTGAIQTRSITNVTSGAVTASTNLVTANSLVAHVANKISAASDTYVTLTTAQTISGIKTFNNGAIFGTHWNISEDSTTNALVFKYVS